MNEDGIKGFDVEGMAADDDDDDEGDDDADDEEVEVCIDEDAPVADDDDGTTETARPSMQILLTVGMLAEGTRGSPAS